MAELAITRTKVQSVLVMVALGLACLLGGALAAACAFLVFAL